VRVPVVIAGFAPTHKPRVPIGKTDVADAIGHLRDEIGDLVDEVR
jgi:hypothetical protein